LIFALLRSYSLCIRCYDESSDLACYHQDSLGNKANYDYLTKFINYGSNNTSMSRKHKKEQSSKNLTSNMYFIAIVCIILIVAIVMFSINSAPPASDSAGSAYTANIVETPGMVKEYSATEPTVYQYLRQEVSQE